MEPGKAEPKGYGVLSLASDFTINNFEKYLLSDVSEEQPGSHLTIASPLSQGQSTWNDTKAVVHLYNPEDALVREHFLERTRESRQGIAIANREKTIREALEGKIVIPKPKTSKSGFKWMFRTSEVNISRRKLIKIGWSREQPVTLRCDVVEEGRHPNMFCSDIESPADPAVRLGISVTSRQGRSDWLSAAGFKTAMKANTLVDELDGIPEEIIEKTPRRYLIEIKDRGRSRGAYT